MNRFVDIFFNGKSKVKDYFSIFNKGIPKYVNEVNNEIQRKHNRKHKRNFKWVAKIYSCSNLDQIDP